MFANIECRTSCEQMLHPSDQIHLNLLEFGSVWISLDQVTACCWLDASTLILAARDDHELHYLDVAADGLKDAVATATMSSRCQLHHYASVLGQIATETTETTKPHLAQ